MICGWPVTFCIASLRISASTFPWILNQWKVNGTELEPIATSPPKPCEKRTALRKFLKKIRLMNYWFSNWHFQFTERLKKQLKNCLAAMWNTSKPTIPMKAKIMSDVLPAVVKLRPFTISLPVCQKEINLNSFIKLLIHFQVWLTAVAVFACLVEWLKNAKVTWKIAVRLPTLIHIKWPKWLSAPLVSINRLSWYFLGPIFHKEE